MEAPAPAAGGIAARAMAARAGGIVVSRRPQPRAARSGRDPGRPGAGAGGGRNRQNPGSDHADRPYPGDRPGAAVRNSLGDLHQQGRSRDERAGRQHGRPGGRGHALARHLPRHRREDPAAARRAGRAQERLHHSRRRRPDPAAEATARGRGHRREALAGPRAGRADRPLEEPRPDAGPGAPAKRRPSPTAEARSSTRRSRSG